MQIVPLQPVPSQTVACLLGGQQCQLNIYTKTQGIFFDLTSNGVDMTIATIARNAVFLDPHASYDGFVGNFIFIDTQGVEDPQFSGLGARWQLVYLDAAEYAAAQIFVSPAALAAAVILTLATTLEVTVPAGGGNFSIPHGLSSVPLLIGIIPTSAGIVWAQSSFADSVNINLVGSFTGVTATVMVYTQAAAGSITVAPAASVVVTSPNFGPFAFAHGLGAIPSLVEILPTSMGEIWETAPADATNLHLAATAAGLTALVGLYAPSAGPINLASPAVQLRPTSIAPGLFSQPHGLPATPSRIQILSISGGQICAQTPGFNATNVNLEASATGVTAIVNVYA
jgi:hypothetical protein